MSSTIPTWILSSRASYHNCIHKSRAPRSSRANPFTSRNHSRRPWRNVSKWIAFPANAASLWPWASTDASPPPRKSWLAPSRPPINRSLCYRIADDDRIRPPEQNWKTSDRLLTETVHIFDLLSFLLKAEPIEIYARETRPNDAIVTIDFANGSRATVFSSSHASLAQPKEHAEAALGDGRFFEMDDYVELRIYGLPDFDPVNTFAGRPYDRCDNRHVDAFTNRGLAALTEQRRFYETAMRESGVLADSSDVTAWAEARQRLGNPPPPQINYAPDKGWGLALEHFCNTVATGQTPQNATGCDGNRATASALAARQSINSGRPVRLDPTLWQS